MENLTNHLDSLYKKIETLQNFSIFMYDEGFKTEEIQPILDRIVTYVEDAKRLENLLDGISKK